MSDQPDLDALAGEFASELTAKLRQHNLVLVPRDLLGKALLTASLGQVMRETQRRYFRTRLREDLIASKEAERAFDIASAALDAAQRPAADA